MRTAEQLVAMLGRTIELLRERSDAQEDLAGALQGLVDATGARSFTLRSDGERLTVDGVVMDAASPSSAAVTRQLDAHGIVEVRFAHRAAAIDLLRFLEAIAPDADPDSMGHDAAAILRAAGESTVTVVSRVSDAKAEGRRRMSVAEALEGTAFVQAGPQPQGDSSAATSTQAGGAGEVTAPQVERGAPATPTIQKLTGGATGYALQQKLDALERDLTQGIEGGRVEHAIDGVATLVRCEAEATDAGTRGVFTAPLRRLLSEPRLKAFGPFLLDELYAADVRTIVRRAGRKGTQVLLDLLVEAPTFAERKAYLAALRVVEEGTDAIAGMLRHPEWYVIRNMADLAGDLRIEEAIDALSNVAGHPDDRVRRSVGAALAKIGTPAVARYLLPMLQDPDENVRLTVVREVGGNSFGPLALPIITAIEGEQNPEVRAELYRALGRIGTSGAIDALKKTAARSSGLLGRRVSADRLAAVEGLALAKSEGARSVLQDLSTDRSREIREAARKGLGETG